MLDYIKKISDLVYDSTIGLVKQYQEKSLDLVKIEAASYYLKSIKTIRQLCLFLVGATVCFMALAVTLIVTPMFLILCAPWTLGTKALAILALGGILFSVLLGFILYFTSEKKWMEISKSNELLEKVTNHS